jgi:eukaryotic-like serine/threonine-protein kinase
VSEGLAHSLYQQGRHDAAIDTCRRSIAADPTFLDAYRMQKESYLALRRWEEARSTWQQWLDSKPPGPQNWAGYTELWTVTNPVGHPAWDGYAELCLFLGNQAEYRRARKELLRRFGTATDPQVAERTGRACLFLPATDDELKQATALIDRALAVEYPNPPWIKPYLRFAKALAEYRAGRMKNAQELLQGDTLRVLPPAPPLLLAMVQHRLGQTDAARKTFNAAVAGYNWDPAKVTNRESWMIHLLRREAEAVLASKP